MVDKIKPVIGAESYVNYDLRIDLNQLSNEYKGIADVLDLIKDGQFHVNQETVTMIQGFKARFSCALTEMMYQPLHDVHAFGALATIAEAMTRAIKKTVLFYLIDNPHKSNDPALLNVKSMASYFEQYGKELRAQDKKHLGM